MSTKIQTDGDKAAKATPKVVGARVGELAPLVEKWIAEHPRVPTARMVEDGLKLLFKSKGYAGKRYAHLVDGVNLAA